MTFKKRRIKNMAADIASKESSEKRDSLIEELEEQREIAGLRTRHIDTALGKPKNWYTNHKRGAGHSHEFSLTLYFTVKQFLEDFQEKCGPIEQYEDEEGELDFGSDLDIEVVRAQARTWRNHALDSIEHVRTEALEYEAEEIDKALDNPKGWYLSRRDADDVEADFSLGDYAELHTFIETAVMFAADSGYVEEEKLDEFVSKGYLSQDVLSSLREI